MPTDHLLLDSAPNIGPLISRWENLTNSKIAETKALEPLNSKTAMRSKTPNAAKMADRIFLDRSNDCHRWEFT